MDPKTLTEVLDLLSMPQAFSRNQNLARFSGDAGKRVWRLYRVYLSLLRDLERAVGEPETMVSARGNGKGNGLRIEMANHKLHWRRINVVPQALVPLFRERLGRPLPGGKPVSVPSLVDEILEVVDENDNVVGTARRGDIHAQGLLHRAAHVLVFDQRGRLYLQKRSMNKDTHPGKWTTSASGHVDPGEDYQSAARRELAEELGLELDIDFVGLIKACPGTEGEFTTVYRAVTNKEPRPNPEEISRGEFFELSEARRLAADKTKAAPCLELVIKLLPV